MTEFYTGRTADQAHHALKSALHTMEKAKLEAAEKSSGQASLLPVVSKRPAAVVPVRVGLEMSPTQFARYEKLWEQIRKTGGVPADQVEALLTVMAGFTDKSATRVDVSPAVQIHVHQCPDCERVAVQTSKGEIELGTAELEQAQGGTNDEDNLISLCSGCHRLVHRQGKVGEPIAVYQTVYQTVAEQHAPSYANPTQQQFPNHPEAPWPVPPVPKKSNPGSGATNCLMVGSSWPGATTRTTTSSP